MNSIAVFFIFVLAFLKAQADPFYEQIHGEWEFHESAQLDSTPNCTIMPSKVVRKFRVKLDFPNVAVDQEGHVGTWTLVYKLGFEMIINYRKYFAIIVDDKSRFTQPGWSHDVLGHNWACYVGYKATHHNTSVSIEHNKDNDEVKRVPNLLEQIDLGYYLSESYVEKVNSRPNLSWRARVYPYFQAISREQLIQLAGGLKSQISSHPKPSVPTEDVRLEASKLPESFDWRNVSGVNYVSPVRKQLCGDCYAQASVGMLEARVRIATENAEKPLFSVQDIIDCTLRAYSYGCDGGLSYLTAGKYAQEFGFTTEQCYPYLGEQGNCSSNTSPECRRRTYTLKYEYIGGYYGACNEELMMLELVQNGPFTAGIIMDNECLLVMTYDSGVFERTPIEVEDRSRYDPVVLIDHSVLIVGYGYDRKRGVKYWEVKNSYGNEWGDRGFFRIRRGTDECGIESLGFAATVIP